MNEFDKARELLRVGDFKHGFETLWRLLDSELLQKALFTSPKQGLKTPFYQVKEHNRRKAIHYFWNDFITRENVFHAIFTGADAQIWLSAYLTKYGQAVPKLYQRLAAQFPAQLLDAIRFNKAFLNDNFYEVFKELSFSDDIHNEHKIAWQNLRKIDKELWAPIPELTDELNKESIHEILIDTCFWIEQKQLKLGVSNQKWLHRLTKVYGLFIDLLSQKIAASTISMSQVQLIELYLRRFQLFKANPTSFDEGKVAQAMDAIWQWTNYTEHLLSGYCFLKANRFQKTKTSWIWASAPKEYYRFLVDGARYGVNMLQYQTLAQHYYEEFKKENLIRIPGDTAADKEINTTLWHTTQAANLYFEDLCLTKYKLKTDQHWDQYETLSLIQAHSTNRGHRYEQKKAELAAKDTKQNYWKLATQLLQEELKTRTGLFPMVYYPYDELIELHHKNARVATKEQVSHLVDELSYAPNPSHFNRHNVYNVWERPFLKLGDHLFVPTAFFSITWFYGFADRQIRESKGDKEPKEFERRTAEKLKKHGLNVVHTGEQNFIGDADLVLYDENLLLFIQLKRTALRTDDEERHIEYASILHKGSKQLSVFREHLAENLSQIDELRDYLKNHPQPKTVSWVVTTSFESVHEVINGSRKVCYFDMVWNLQPYNGITLDHFIKIVEADEYLRKWHQMATPLSYFLPELSQYLDVVPIPIPNSKDYCVSFRGQDHAAVLAVDYYNKAYQYEQEGKIDQAISLYLHAVEIDDLDPDTWDALGNLWANKGEHALAIDAFQKALKALHGDPRIWRNYLLCISESGNETEARKEKEQFIRTYPLLRHDLL